jgi:flavin-dependent dehydrogenase
VIVLERDPQPPPPDPDAAYSDWERRGVGQFGLGHWLHARGTQILRDEVPTAYGLLRDNGGLEFNFMRYVAAMTGLDVGDDLDRFDLLTGRRSTMEWALATAADRHAGVTVRRGVAVTGFTTGAEVRPGVPHVTGLRLADGEEVTADLVIDATGRRSPTPDWLVDIGATPPLDEAEDSGFAYYGRYYRSTDGSTPPIMGPLLAPYESFSILTLPSDNGTWVATLYGLAEDKVMRKSRDVEAFERVMRACPLHAHWIDGEPISEMKSMAGVVDRHRQFVVDGEPCATGVLTIADAASCTNPSLGRGISIGLMHAEVARSCIAEHLDDPDTLAMVFHERSEGEIRPWHDATIAIDRRRVDEMRTYLAGGTPQPTPEQQLADTLNAAVGSDPLVTRSAMEMFSCLVLPDEVFGRPGFVEHLQSLQGTVSNDPIPGPDRAELEALLTA